MGVEISDAYGVRIFYNFEMYISSSVAILIARRGLRGLIPMVNFVGPVRSLLHFDPVSISWTDLTLFTTGPTPSPRSQHGFAAFRRKLFIFGGHDMVGGEYSRR